MSDFETSQPAYQEASWKEENRQNEWAEKRADRDSLRSGLEQSTEHMDDPPEKISLDDEPFDRFKRHGDIRSGIAASIDQSFYNSANAEKRERYISEFDLIDKHVQRSHGVDGVTGLKQMLQIDEGIRSPDFQTRVATVEHIINLAHNNSDYGRAAQQRMHDNTVKDIEAVERKYDISPQVWDHVADFMSTPAFQRTKTGDNEADVLRAVRMVKEGMKRVKFR